MLYSRTFFSKDEIENAIAGKIEPLEINRILSAYDMSDMAFSDKMSLNGTPYFFHTTRVCKIIIQELEIFDSDLIIAALLHDIFEVNEDISPEIIDYNFGPYVTYLLSILKEDFHSIDSIPAPALDDSANVKIPTDDYLIIWLSEHLDNFRALDVSPVFNPVNYILNTLSLHIPAAEQSNNIYVQRLMIELKKERNKILG
ncbi:hypothetical protein MASR1M45_17420 [Candidatus Kapaibacterium sp.]